MLTPHILKEVATGYMLYCYYQDHGVIGREAVYRVFIYVCGLEQIL